MKRAFCAREARRHTHLNRENRNPTPNIPLAIILIQCFFSLLLSPWTGRINRGHKLSQLPLDLFYKSHRSFSIVHQRQSTTMPDAVPLSSPQATCPSTCLLSLATKVIYRVRNPVTNIFRPFRKTRLFNHL